MNYRLLAATAVAALYPFAAQADEGMWTFDAFPTAKVQAAYGSAPDQKWLDTVRASAVRLTGGCSASVVSLQGLVLTNNHCVVDCAQANSTAQTDYLQTGFVAIDKPKELKCPGQQAEIVTAISDVTPDIMKAIGSLTGAALAKARDGAIAAIEAAGCTDKAKERCQVVTLYGGGQYKLYRYRKYSDVRLVYAPEFQAAFFGGDPDNFNFPRYDNDAAFLRLYEDGKPVTTKAHLKWNPRAPKTGEVTYVVGNPGSTQRLYTQAQMGLLRNVSLPATLIYISELRGRLISAREANPEQERTGADMLFSIENGFKVYFGQEKALLDPDFSAKLAANEADLRAKVAADPTLKARIGDPWGEIEKAVANYRNFFDRYSWLERRAGGPSDLYGYARTIVRAAEERTKPDADRLPEYSNSKLALMEKQLTDARPVYPWLEKLSVELWLTKAREYLTADAPEVKRLLGKESPEALSARLITGTTLADPKVRKALFDGGIDAVKASKDPLIEFVLAHDADPRALKTRYRDEYDAPVTAAQSRLAQARFAVYGNTLYPDATFTLRISYGAVKGWSYQGTDIPDTTNFAGLYERATGAPPFDLPPKWAAAETKIDKTRVFNYVTTNDITGGNSGSPVIAVDGSVIGAAFDGNIHSIGGDFGFDAAVNRTVVVSMGAVDEALTKVYPAPELLKELKAK